MGLLQEKIELKLKKEKMGGKLEEGAKILLMVVAVLIILVAVLIIPTISSQSTDGDYDVCGPGGSDDWLCFSMPSTPCDYGCVPIKCDPDKECCEKDCGVGEGCASTIIFGDDNPCVLNKPNCAGRKASKTTKNCAPGEGPLACTFTGVFNPDCKFGMTGCYIYESYVQTCVPCPTADDQACPLISTGYNSEWNRYAQITDTCCSEPTPFCDQKFHETSEGCFPYVSGDDPYRRDCSECFVYPGGQEVSENCMAQGKTSCCAGKCYNEIIADCCGNEIPNKVDNRGVMSNNKYCDNSPLCTGGSPVCTYKYDWEEGTDVQDGDWNCVIDTIEKYGFDGVRVRTCAECSGNSEFDSSIGEYGRYFDVDCRRKYGIKNAQCCHGKCYNADIEHCCSSSNGCENEIAPGPATDKPGNPGFGECCDKDGNGVSETHCIGTKPYCVVKTKWNNWHSGMDLGELCTAEKGLKKGEVQHVCAECRSDLDCNKSYNSEFFKCCKQDGGKNKCYDSRNKSCCSQIDDPRCDDEVRGSFHLSPGSECMGTISSTACCGDPCVKCSGGSNTFCERKDKDPFEVYADALAAHTFLYEDGGPTERIKLWNALNAQKFSRYPDELRTCWVNIKSITDTQKTVFKSLIQNTEIAVAPPNDEEKGCGGDKCGCKIDIPLINNLLDNPDSSKFVFAFPHLAGGIDVTLHQEEENVGDSCVFVKKFHIFGLYGLFWQMGDDPDDDGRKKQGVKPKPQPKPKPKPEPEPKPKPEPPSAKIPGFAPGGRYYVVAGAEIEKPGSTTVSSTATSPLLVVAGAGEETGECEIGCSGISLSDLLLVGGIGGQFGSNWGPLEDKIGEFYLLYSPASGPGIAVGTQVSLFEKVITILVPIGGISTPYLAAMVLVNLPLIDEAVEYAIGSVPLIGDCYHALRAIVGSVIGGVECLVGGIANFLCGLLGGGTCSCTGGTCTMVTPPPVSPEPTP